MADNCKKDNKGAGTSAKKSDQSHKAKPKSNPSQIPYSKKDPQKDINSSKDFPTISVNQVEKSKPVAYTSQESGPRKIEDESDKNYHKIVSDIVTSANKHLEDQDKCKRNIRKVCLIFFICFISVQLFALIALIAFSAMCKIPFYISDNLLSTLIKSLFVETLGAISVMIGFAFASKDEVKTIELLTAVVRNYQKYHGEGYEDLEAKGNDSDEDKNKKQSTFSRNKHSDKSV